MSGLSDELGATLSARKELGDQYERELVRSFLEKVDREVDARLELRLGDQRRPTREPSLRGRRRGFTAVPIASLIFGIPISAIVTSTLHGDEGLIALVVAWGGIALVNFAHALGRQREV